VLLGLGKFIIVFHGFYRAALVIFDSLDLGTDATVINKLVVIRTMRARCRNLL